MLHGFVWADSGRDSASHTFQGIDEAACAAPANPVVAENCLPGTNEWISDNYSDSIEVFTSLDSVNTGEQVDLFVNTSASQYDLYVYRTGYYGGLGGRLVFSRSGLRGNQQPPCARAEDTGLRTCSNWSSSFTLPIPTEWVSGIYIVRVQRPDTGGENDTAFVVRNDDRPAEILYQHSVSTLQAYNNYGGKSAYNWNSGFCSTVAQAPRAVRISLNRPYSQFKMGPDYFYRAEYPMVRWLEQQGYDVTYSTTQDTHRAGKPGAVNTLLDHKVFLSAGHDEYWSQEMRDAITAARDAGVHLGFFTANTAYWRVRFEPDPLTNEPDSVMVTYKTTESGPVDSSGFHTGTWRDPAGANDPENGLLGALYIGDNDRFYFPMRVSAQEAQDSIYRHTGLQSMPSDTYVEFGDHVVGWKWDARADNGREPEGLTVLATSPVFGMLLQDAGNSANGNLALAAAHMVRYTAESGAIVFSSGTIQWSWGLGARGLEIVEPDRFIPQMTYNILADMGLQPATPSDNLILDGSGVEPAPLPDSLFKRAADVIPPTVSNLQTAVNGTSVTVTWETDQPAAGQLWYGTRAGHIIFTGGVDETYKTSHSFTLDGLKPNTPYFFKAASVNDMWGVTISDETQVTAGGLSSFGDQISYTLDPVIRGGGCFVRANMTGLIVIAISVLIGLAFLAWNMSSRARLRRAAQN
ncbi:MAG: fibronectin type III domain-containing protein [Anaerolineae bacterium]|nr:fibronectin type III domain-containing protein [Anaerolineae bacterium]